MADMSGISDISDGWTRPLSVSMPSPPLWEPPFHKSTSSEVRYFPNLHFFTLIIGQRTSFLRLDRLPFPFLV